jgi:hypothetical protein
MSAPAAAVSSSNSAPRDDGRALVVPLTPAVSRMDTQEYLRRLSTAFAGIRVDGIDGISRVYLRILSCLLRATKTFYFAMWCCDFMMELYDGRSFHDWIVLRCQEAPDLRIHGMLHDNPENVFPDGWDKARQVYPHARVSIRIVPMYNRGTMAYLLHRHPGSNCMHQKWVLSDRRHLLWSGCDIRPIYRCDFPRGERNRAGWYWRDYTLHLRPDKASRMTELPPSWTDFLIANVHAGGQLSRTEGLIPLPFINQFSLPMSEASILVFSIETAERFVYIENQYFHSSKATDNRLMEALVNRLRRALAERQDDFHVVIVSNWEMKDEKSVINAWGIQSSLCSSISTLHSMSKCSMEDLDRHVWIGYAEEQVGAGDYAAVTMVSPASSFVLGAASTSSTSPTPSVDSANSTTPGAASCVPATPGGGATASTGVAAQASRSPLPIPIYVHTKLFCADESTLVSGSANGCDRSLSRDNSDNELSLVLFRQPQLVRPLFQQVIRSLAGAPPSAVAQDGVSSPAAEERWEMADLFRSLAVARLTGQPFRCFHPIERQLPRGFSVWGSVFEIANYGYL